LYKQTNDELTIKSVCRLPRIEKLPPTKWPQLDHGTAIAVINGTGLGKKCFEKVEMHNEDQ